MMTPEKHIEGASDRMVDLSASSQDSIGERSEDISRTIDAVLFTKDQTRLKEMRESGELSPHDFDLNELALFLENDVPLTGSDLRNQAVALSRGDFESLGGVMRIIYKNGEEIIFEAESMTNPVLIIFPQDLQ
jgi:hypothetical protein